MRLAKYDLEVAEVGDNLFRIVLPQPFYDKNSVYLLRDKATTLIDSGYIESIGQLSRSLRYLGLSLRKIHYLIYTHNHIDHMSGGLLFPVYAPQVCRIGYWRLDEVQDFLLYFHAWIHENERLMKLVHSDPTQRNEACERVRSYWYSFLERFETKERKRGERFVELYRGVKEDDVIDTGSHKLKVLETPGHNKWHISLVEESEKWLFSGDLIIGNIPAIYDQLDGSLMDYYSTMHRLLGGYSHLRFFPGHGDVIEEPARKIRVLLKTLSLMERNVQKRLSGEPINLYDLAQKMMGNSIISDSHFLVAVALLEAILRKLMKESRVGSILYHNGYEEFYLV